MEARRTVHIGLICDSFFMIISWCLNDVQIFTIFSQGTWLYVLHCSLVSSCVRDQIEVMKKFEGNRRGEECETAAPKALPPELRRSYAGAPPELRRTYAGATTELCMGYAGAPLELHRSYAEALPGLRRRYAGAPLDFHRSYTGVPLELHRSSAGALPELHQCSDWAMPAIHWSSAEATLKLP